MSAQLDRIEEQLSGIIAKQNQMARTLNRLQKDMKLGNHPRQGWTPTGRDRNGACWPYEPSREFLHRFRVDSLIAFVKNNPRISPDVAATIIREIEEQEAEVEAALAENVPPEPPAEPPA